MFLSYPFSSFFFLFPTNVLFCSGCSGLSYAHVSGFVTRITFSSFCHNHFIISRSSRCFVSCLYKCFALFLPRWYLFAWFGWACQRPSSVCGPCSKALGHSKAHPRTCTSIWFCFVLFDINWSLQLFQIRMWQVFGHVGNLQSLLILHFHCISFHSCLRKLRRSFSGASQSLANMPCFNSPLLAAFCTVIAACLLVTKKIEWQMQQMLLSLARCNDFIPRFKRCSFRYLIWARCHEGEHRGWNRFRHMKEKRKKHTEKCEGPFAYSSRWCNWKVPETLCWGALVLV